MAASTTINGSTNNQYWTYKLVVNEISTDIANRTSTITVEHFLGRKSGAGSSYFSGPYTIKSTVNGETKSTNKSMDSGTIPSGGWKSIGSHTFTVSNTGNPTTINISGQQTSSIFSPSKSTASGSMDLTILHIPPTISNVSVQENNTTLTNLGVLNSELVYYLSNKTFTITATANDEATLTTYNVYNNNMLIGTSNTNTVTVNFANVNLGNDGILKFEVVDSLQGKSFQEWQYPSIQYTKPALELTSTTIKRKTDANTGLADNQTVLNLIGGYYYDANNVVGRNTTISSIEYKIWNESDPEPSYTNVVTQATISNGSVTIPKPNEELIIYNIDFQKVYRYKIIMTDNFGNQTELKEGTVPTGIAVWTEFADRVDFTKISVNNQAILMPYSLYDNSSGSNGTIALSDSAANYEFLEIFYKDDINQYTSTKIYQPNGKRITLFMSVINPSNSQTFVQSACKDINGTSITHQKASEVRIDSHNANTNNYIYITKVIGYK